MSATDAPAAPPTATQKTKRPICQGCAFPKRTCICPSLPPEPLSSLFHRCRIVVLQHPHELRRKNRSLPLVELCLFGKGHREGENGETAEETTQQTPQTNTSEDTAVEEDFVMKTVVSRRFGDHCDEAVMKILRDPSQVVVLVFPHKDALGLEEGIRLAEERCSYAKEKGQEKEENANGECLDSDAASPNNTTDATCKRKMTLVFIDATWKHAREMETRTNDAGEWPKNLIRVQMTPSAAENDNKHDGKAAVSDARSRGIVHKAAEGSNALPTFIERRFHIRTPPSPDHLSTAECLAWIASRVEHNPTIYQSVMKSLDYMVGLWQSFTADNNRGGKVRGFTNGDGCWDSMSQKKRKIKKNG
ncbi:hypothetical protein ACHAXT_006941 [Thalassiosira profunda]